MTNGQELMKVERGSLTREDFAGKELQTAAETSMAGVTAREKALIEAQYLMSERHPRTWADVRFRMLEHCTRPRFAEVSRYKKPVGKKLVNGEWTDQFATGFTIRFAESLAQEMRNVKPDSSITFEDDRIRIVRISVTDLQNNVPWSREVVIAKTVEKRGKKERDGSFTAPKDREVISHRLNSYGDPTFLVVATDDELRAKMNSEISKTQRDFVIKLCPRDILEDCEDRVYGTLEAADKTDPKAALKRWLDSFAKIGVLPSDLGNYIGKSVDGFGARDIAELRELSQAIKEGATFQSCLKAKYDIPADGEDETPQQRDARHQRDRAAQDELAQKKMAEMDDQQPADKPRRGRPPKQEPAPPTTPSSPEPPVQRELTEEEKMFNSIPIEKRRTLWDQFKQQLGDERYYGVLTANGGALNYKTYQDLNAAVAQSEDVIA